MFLRFRFASILAIVVFASITGCQKLTPQQAHFESAYKAFNKGDYETALLYLKPLVEAGHPAAQLLLAKMYANGDGVEEDMGKAELLRNLAAYQVYKNKDFTPGEERPANETLKSISDRLDYYVGAQEGNKAPTQDLDSVMQSIGVKNMFDLRQKDENNLEAAQPDLSVDMPHEDTKSPADAVEPVSEPVRAETTQAPPAKTMAASDTRQSDQITLGIVRQAASSGDPMAMELLAAAYTKGFYGLVPSADQAKKWKSMARDARVQRLPSADLDSPEKIPMEHVWKLFSAGVLFIGIGVWQWWKTRY